MYSTGLKFLVLRRWLLLASSIRCMPDDTNVLKDFLLLDLRFVVVVGVVVSES